MTSKARITCLVLIVMQKITQHREQDTSGCNGGACLEQRDQPDISGCNGGVRAKQRAEHDSVFVAEARTRSGNS